MSEPEAAGEARRYHVATCPVCRELALKTFVAEQVVQFECGGCGSFGITAAARPILSGKSQEVCRGWLERARQQVAASGGFALVDIENQPIA
ncbi:MAG TPA: hypothetical protein VIZ90_05825 [Rhizobiaceae bacterium]